MCLTNERERAAEYCEILCNESRSAGWFEAFETVHYNECTFRMRMRLGDLHLNRHNRMYRRLSTGVIEIAHV